MYFEATNRILSVSLVAIANSRKLRPEQALQKATDYLKVMSEQWYKDEAPQIAYDDPLCRWAYVYAHVPAHANLFEKVIEINARDREEFRNKLSGDDVSLLVFGGGPGTELLGLAKYFFYNKTVAQIDVKFTLIDRVAAWSENLSSILEEIEDVYTTKFGRRVKWPAQFRVNSFPFDFSDLISFGNLPSLFKKDIFAFSFVISEVFDLSIVLPIMKAMVQGCPSGAFFLFIDRADAETDAKIEELIHALGLRDEGGAKVRGSMDPDEEKTALQEFSKPIGREPRLKWDAQWKLAAKA